MFSVAAQGYVHVQFWLSLVCNSLGSTPLLHFGNYAYIQGLNV